MQVYLQMVRRYWLEKVKDAWNEKTVVWLTGVRRSGKTTLCKALTPDGYFDCELPRIRRLLEDPEEFFKTCKQKAVTLDEIHRLENASEVLKIAADHFPELTVIATGSSTLGASRKFKDTLTDRKRTVFLPPMCVQDLVDFGMKSIDRRMVNGGLPPFFLSSAFPEKSYQEWMDSFWAKDIEELFNIEKKGAFLKFFELLGLQSGGIFEAKSFSAPCGVSHTTIASYLNIMEQTHIAYVLRPFHKRASKEIISTPKVYFFDTGFITFFNGVSELHPKERGIYWEHLVLNELLTFVDRGDIHIWRDKSKNEVDFIIKRRGKDPIAVECKWKASEFNPHGLKVFRGIHPKGANLMVSSDITAPRTKKFENLAITFLPLERLRKALATL
jgi:predicted AAA+ superfamily ATPase